MQNEKEARNAAAKTQNKGRVKRTMIECEDDSSEWSLQSLEDLKGINLHQLQEMQQNMLSRPKEKQMFEAKFPQKPAVLANAPIHQIGKVILIVGQLWILQANSATSVVDLDNWVADENRNLLGFVMDVLGKVESPFYAIKPEQACQPHLCLGRPLYYIEGTSKILKDDDIKSMQSKSAMEAVQDDLSSSDEGGQRERDFSAERREQREGPYKRRSKFRQQEDRRPSRERTRQHRPYNRNSSRPRNQQNQRYLEGMYRMHYNEMLQLQHGFIPPNTRSPYVNQPIGQPQFSHPRNPFANNSISPQEFIHSNVAQFGSSNTPQLFYGQVYQPNFGQGQPGLFMSPQQFQNNAQEGPSNAFSHKTFEGPRFPGNDKRQ